MNDKLKLTIISNDFVDMDGKFDMDKALLKAGKIAGICYDEHGYEHILEETDEKTMKRVKRTIENGHHSVYDHIWVSLDIQNIPKLMAMLINNEHQYTTSEKSLRYTKIGEDYIKSITPLELEYYNKWMAIFEDVIKEEYGYLYKPGKIRKLAQENARYLVTVFIPTEMVYSTTLRQLNNLASFMEEYIQNFKALDNLSIRLVPIMKKFLKELERLNLLEPRLMTNQKNRHFSLFGQDLEKHEDYFSYVYDTNYLISFAGLAQGQRHRTINYQMQSLDDKKFFVPPIIEDKASLKDEWLHDANLLKAFAIQGELVLVNEEARYQDFILKCKERLCTAAQLEIMLQTKATLMKYKEALQKSNHPLYSDIEKYSKGARCTFEGFVCTEDCHFKEGKTLTRKI